VTPLWPQWTFGSIDSPPSVLNPEKLPLGSLPGPNPGMSHL